MISILTVGQERGFPKGLLAALEKYDDVLVSNSESGKEALDTFSERTFDLAVVSEELDGMGPFELVEKMVLINPMINCVLTSSMSDNAFHEATEGLGVMGRLDVKFDENQLKELMRNLRKILNSTGETINDS